MAKKVSYQKLEDCWNVEIKSDGPDKSVIIFKGRNSKGTGTIVTVKVEDCFFPHLIKDMANIARSRVKTATSRLDSVYKAINE